VSVQEKFSNTSFLEPPSAITTFPIPESFRNLLHYVIPRAPRALVYRLQPQYSCWMRRMPTCSQAFHSNVVFSRVSRLVPIPVSHSQHSPYHKGCRPHFLVHEQFARLFPSLILCPQTFPSFKAYYIGKPAIISIAGWSDLSLCQRNSVHLILFVMSHTFTCPRITAHASCYPKNSTP
jgi:hypothetical protein